MPELVGASKDLYLLGRVNAAWLAAGVLLEGASLFCYGLLTRALLPPGSVNPGLSRLFRIDLAAAAMAHVIPAGTVGSAGIGYRLFTAEGIDSRDAAVMMATEGLGLYRGAERAVVAVAGHLHPASRVSPDLRDRDHHRAVVMLAIATLAFGITRRSKRASRILRVAGERVPGLTGDRLEQAIVKARNSLSALASDRRTLAASLTWDGLSQVGGRLQPAAALPTEPRPWLRETQTTKHGRQRTSAVEDL